MTSLGEIKNNKIREKYKEKLEKLKVSPDMINKRDSKYSINIIKILKSVCNKKELDNELMIELASSGGTGFYDYSILVGMHYGVYNLYCYNNLSSNLIELILAKRPNVEDTKTIFATYDEEIVQFLAKKYSVDEKSVYNIMRRMFTVIDNNSLYNNHIVTDINKILFALELRCNKEQLETKHDEVVDGIMTGEFIDYYNIINERKEEVNITHKNK